MIDADFRIDFLILEFMDFVYLNMFTTIYKRERNGHYIFKICKNNINNQVVEISTGKRRRVCLVNCQKLK